MKIYCDDKWIVPWTIEDLYECAYEIEHKVDILNALVKEANKDEDDLSDDEHDEHDFLNEDGEID